MKAYLENYPDEIGDIAIRLADNFAKALYNFSNTKSYGEYIENLKEILNWSQEFYTQYSLKLNDWESFKRSSHNIYKAADRENFLIAWGKDRIRRFYDEHPKNKEYSPGKTG